MQAFWPDRNCTPFWHAIAPAIGVARGPADSRLPNRRDALNFNRTECQAGSAIRAYRLHRKARRLRRADARDTDPMPGKMLSRSLTSETTRGYICAEIKH